MFKITAESRTVGGIEYTVNDDGTVSANGTSTGAYLNLNDMTLKKGTYTFSGGPENGGPTSQKLSIYDMSKGSGSNVIVLDALYGEKTYTHTFEEDTDIRITYVVPAGTIVNNEVVKLQVEHGNKVTEFTKNKEDNCILPIQQEMLNGDYFELEEDGWKEVHTFPKIRLLNQDFKKSTKTEVNRYYVANIVNISADRNSVNVLSEHFLGITATQSDNNKLGISNYNDNGFMINIDKSDTSLDTVGKFKTFLQNNEVYAYYKTTTPTKLACTEEQSAILDKLNELDMFDGTNNIITTEDIALLKSKYVVDTKTYIDNQINERLSNIESQILELAGGN